MEEEEEVERERETGGVLTRSDPDGLASAPAALTPAADAGTVDGCCGESTGIMENLDDVRSRGRGVWASRFVQ